MSVSPVLGQRNENHMRKYSPVCGVKCAHERRNSNQIGFLWQTITFILNQRHFSQAEAVALVLIRARLVLAPEWRDVANLAVFVLAWQVGGHVSTGVRQDGTTV